MDTLIHVPLVFGSILVGAALVYLIVRISTRAYYKSKREYEKEKKHDKRV